MTLTTAATVTATDVSDVTKTASTSPQIPVTATYAISGTVTPAVGGAGTTLTLTGASIESTIADALGDYTLANLTSGSYTVTPSKPGFTFVPASRLTFVAAGSVSAVDFSAAAVDAGTADAGEADAGAADAGTVDAGIEDGGSVDAGAMDAGVPPPDAGDGETAISDAGAMQGLDAGAREPTTLATGCGCASGGAGEAWFAVAFALSFARRRRRAPDRMNQAAPRPA